MNVINSTPSLRARRKAEDRSRIYRVALALIHEKGYEGTTVRDITAAAGVALGTFFNHFPTKEHLLVDYYVQLRQEVARSLGQPHRDLVAFLGAFTELVAGQMRAHPELFEAVGAHLATSPALQAAEQAACGDMLRHAAEAVARGQSSGELTARVTPDEAAILILLVFNGAIAESTPIVSVEAFLGRLQANLDPLIRLLRA